EPVAPAPGANAASAKPSDPAAPETTITGEWTGRLVVTPVSVSGENAQPKEFGDNKLAVRLHAGQAPVRVQDDAFKGRMTAARVDFGATTRELTLASTPAIPVEIDVDGTGKLVGKGAAVNLGTGKVDLIGGGTLTPAPAALARATAPAAPETTSPTTNPDAAPPTTTLNFSNTLVLQFATVGNFITPDLKTADIKGGFTADSGEVKASADEATVLFNDPLTGGKTTIKQLRMSGNAVASAPAASTAATLTATGGAPVAGAPIGPRRDTLKGEQITVNFAADAKTGEQQPSGIEVAGSAQATAGGGGEGGLNLKARTITADLAKDAKGQLAVTKAVAVDDVHVTDGADGREPTFAASADRLEVDPAAGIADLYGKPVTVSRDGAVMTGGHLKLTQATGEAFIDGPGTVSSLADGDPAKDEPMSSSLATWTKSMTFNSVTGRAECVGDASATMTRGDVERNTLQASTVLLQFTPAPKKDEKPAPGAPGAEKKQRELISAEAVGELGIDGRPPRPATLENREFITENGEQKLQRLTYLEGFRIIANHPNRTLEVPVAGKLLVDDRTPGAKPAAPARPTQPGSPVAPLGGFNSTSGTSLFTWSGSMNLDLIKGEAVLKRDIALTHQPLATPAQPSPPQTTLDCDQLTAFLKVKAPQAGGARANAPLARLDASLERVEAVGNVVAKSEGKQLTAHSLLYDTVREFMEAAGKDGTDQPLVTFVDPARPAPLRARRITWDQKNGEVRIIEPAPTTIGQ
ncbi:MAG TPA: hypothetical protein VEB22_08545, partial [Phycisphaerales bacterium]|nr:hypothetical protein [Phycisphaerales bacterium]